MNTIIEIRLFNQNKTDIDFNLIKNNKYIKPHIDNNEIHITEINSYDKDDGFGYSKPAIRTLGIIPKYKQAGIPETNINEHECREVVVLRDDIFDENTEMFLNDMCYTIHLLIERYREIYNKLNEN